MRTSATGTSANSRRRAARCAQRGFTFVEILVVVVIIGVVAVGALLSLGVLGGDRELDTERDRLQALVALVREEAAQQGREYGLRIFIGGYEFLDFDPRSGRWEPVPEDRTLRRRSWPAGLEAALRVEGRPVVLPKSDAKDATPQVMLFSSGEVGAFELTVAREGSATQGFRLRQGRDGDSVEALALGEASP
jgi:general secretion pathway protein H